MPRKFGDDYEYHRWFKDAIQQTGYAQTEAAITRHLLDDTVLHPARILELGPGAGTWTKLLLKWFPQAGVTLLDISKEMLKRAQGAVGTNSHVELIESDILEWTPRATYDLFFSSRVLEYIDAKQKFCEIIFSALESQGKGFLITKMPHYARERLLGRAKSPLHQGQIAPRILSDMLTKAGFATVECFPVTMTVPLLHCHFANQLIGKLFAGRRLRPLGMFFTESYCVIFKKP